MISTRNSELLPDVRTLRRAFQAMATADAILMREWEYRYYSFSANRSNDGIALGSMRDGSGDDLHAVFGPAGCLLRGFAHEHAMSPYAETPPRVFPGVIDEIPPEFLALRAELHEDWWQDITFCLWRGPTDTTWRHGRIEFPAGTDPDGSSTLLSIFDGRPETYVAWARQYYDRRESGLDAVRRIFAHEPLTEEIVRSLNSEVSLEELEEDLREIGYPAAE